MRKILKIATCTIALACAGMSQAANETGLSSVESQIGTRVQQLIQFVQGAPATPVKAQGAFDTGNGTRTRPAAVISQAEERTSHAMLLAGLLVMGVIIKRRSGKRD